MRSHVITVDLLFQREFFALLDKRVEPCARIDADGSAHRDDDEWPQGRDEELVPDEAVPGGVGGGG